MNYLIYRDIILRQGFCWSKLSGVSITCGHIVKEGKGSFLFAAIDRSLSRH